MSRQTLGLAALVIAGISFSFTAAAGDMESIKVVIAPVESGVDECQLWLEIDADCHDK